jgi:DNA-binding beta-propeller fold protein YncE
MPTLSEVPSETFIKELHFHGRVKIFGSRGQGTGEFQHPIDIATNRDGEIYVVDRKQNKVQKFNKRSEIISSLNPSSGFHHPLAVAVTPKEETVILDSGAHRLVLFDTFDNEIKSFGKPGSKPGQFSYPRDLMVDPASGNYLIADYGNLRVQEISSKGKFLKFFLYIHPKTIEKGAPESLALYKDKLYVLYGDYNEIVVFARHTTSLIKTISNKSLKQKLFINPKRITIGPQGFLFVSDPGANAVFVLNSKGELQARLESSARRFGTVKSPEAVFMDELGNLYISDMHNVNIQIFYARKEFQILQKANRNYSEKNLALALPLYEKVLSENPQNKMAIDRIIKILDLQSAKHLVQKNYDQALTTLNKLLSFHASNRSAITRKRIVLWKKHRGWLQYMALGISFSLVFLISVQILWKRIKSPA